MPVLHDCFLWLCGCTARKENSEESRPLFDFPVTSFCPRSAGKGASPHISSPVDSISNRPSRFEAHSLGSRSFSLGQTLPARRMTRVLPFVERGVAWRPHVCFT